MIDDQAQAPEAEAKARRARDEAAAWYAKLNGPRIGNAELAAFYDWRSDTLNDAAYTQIEALATGARALADDPRLQAIAEAAVRRPRESAGPLAWLGARPVTSAGFGAALTAAAVVAALLLAQTGQQTYRTAVGERRAISLADGSTVELNTDSQVRVRLSRTRRDLTLDRGQAMFAVAHDADRPFIVKAGDTAVRAIGTRFEVYKAQDAVRVTLAEGRVQVTQGRGKPGGQAVTPPAPVILTAGQRVDMGLAPGRPVAVDVAAATGWTSGRLTFKDTRLAEAVAEINRYSRRRVVLGAGAPADERVNGVFDTGDTDAFVAGMTAALDLRSAPRADGSVELIGPASGPA